MIYEFREWDLSLALALHILTNLPKNQKHKNLIFVKNFAIWNVSLLPRHDEFPSAMAIHHHHQPPPSGIMPIKEMTRKNTPIFQPCSRSSICWLIILWKYKTAACAVSLARINVCLDCRYVCSFSSIIVLECKLLLWNSSNSNNS